MIGGGRVRRAIEYFIFAFFRDFSGTGRLNIFVYLEVNSTCRGFILLVTRRPN